MKCFNHQDIDAVGMCKHCHKGVCVNCATDTGDGLACAGDCELKIRAINRLISNNVNATNAFKFGRFLLPGFFISMGLVIVISAVLSDRSLKPIDLMGGIFIVMGIVYLVYNFKAIKLSDKNT